MITQGINNYYQVPNTNQSVRENQRNTQTVSDAQQGQKIAQSPNRSVDRAFDFTNMTLAEQSNAAKVLYDQGVLSMGEMAFMTGRYGLIEHDGSLGGTTLEQANSERFNVIANMKESLATVKGQGQATPEVINNYNTLIRKLEVYQFGLNTSA
ncbi:MULTISPECIES: hypothetical protein [Pseudoalteromonas]|uniref:Uncharacterized protein n=1 Tax=Pseudoalteromonas amylolytica TaxID=1859457 RepID=A0A1S1MKE5_9GAMM|nr:MULTISPECIES: hypothetical protein [Pseudoalteromonas]MCF6437227.1 hypothetical protein [Pseudoalteromonas sp. MMG022]OHU84331.1 hypothetical protein BFC16_01445 [Pseudoalteromonas sp. JW3]OHU87130.1 hypothetical protein BET10_00495 [Pseudoalteromonas amylolytica]